MSTLVLPLPSRPSHASASAPGAASGFDWLLLGDDGQPLGEGHSLPAELPKTNQLVLLLPEHAVSWHRVTLPRTGPQRWRAALVGLLEEQLLEDPEHLHWALEAQARGGEPAWVAATPKAPLLEVLQSLEGAQRLVDRIVPRSPPGGPGQGWFFTDPSGPQLRWSDADGVLTLPLRGNLAKARLPQAALDDGDWHANPDTLQAAEQWLGRPVAVGGLAQQAARALASAWNLRQFDLAPRLRGLHWLRQLGHRAMHPQWRAARLGLVAWIGLGLVGLNALAWQQRQLVAQRQQQVEATLKSVFPRVSYVADPAAQMQKELASLRAQAGELGEHDLETLLSVLSLAWPPDRPPLDALAFESGQLSLPAAGWTEAQVTELRRALASEGWQLTQDAHRLILRHAAP